MKNQIGLINDYSSSRETQKRFSQVSVPLWTGIGILLLFASVSVSNAQFNNDFYQGVMAPQIHNPMQNASRQNTAPARRDAPQQQYNNLGARKQSGSLLNAKLQLPQSMKALLFSVNNYDQGSSGLPNLEGCNNDIFEWDVLLKEPQGTGRLTAGPLTGNKSLFTFSDDPEVSSNLPTYDNFMAALKTIASSSDVPADRLLIVFSGHGVSAYGKSFLCPQDALGADLSAATPENVLASGRASKLIPVSDVIQTLRQSNAKEILLIIDACRDASSGQEGFMREFADLVKNTESTLGRNFAILTSCSMGQTAHEFVFEDCAHGAFMYHFIDGLVNCKADYSGCYDGKITLVEAYNYAYAQTAREARSLGTTQTPEIFVSANSSNMCLAAYDKAPKIENERDLNDLQFLTRTGQILADNTRSAQENQLAVKAFDCVIDNIPNNTLAYTLRGGIHRNYGNYAKSLADCQQAGIQLSLNVSLELKIPFSNGQTQTMQKGDTVNVIKVDGDKLLISAINETPLLEQYVWLKSSYVEWSAQSASNTIRNSVMQNQKTRYPGGPASYQTSPGRRGPVNGGAGTGMGFFKI